MSQVDLTKLIKTGQFVGLREWPGYGVSSDGRVWTCKVNLGDGNYILGDQYRQLIAHQTATRCYPAVNLCRDGKMKTILVHHLVLEAFVGPRPPGGLGCHKDDNPLNNSVDNLKWGTRQSNSADARRNGGYSPPPRTIGSNHPSAKLNEKAILRIRGLDQQGFDLRQIGKIFGVSKSTISRIVRGESWKHI